MAYVVRDLETYVTAVQFPRGLSAWDAQSFVEARVKRLLQPYRDEVARREEAESRRKKLANLMEFGRRHLRRETFLLPKEEAEEVEGEVERDMVRRMKWNWSEESVRDLVDEVLDDLRWEDSDEESDLGRG